MQHRATSSRREQPVERLARPIGIGVVAGMAAAAGVRLGRKVMATARTGQGHPLKQRVLDLAAGAMQPKYPLDAMSTYLNGFHMYADEMARQVEASHFCIHLRHDLHQCVIFDDRRLGISTAHKRQNRADIPDPEVLPGANSWQSGRTVQTRLEEVDFTG